MRVPLRVYGMVTIYIHEMEETNILGRHHRRSISNQDSSRLLRAVHGVHEMLSAHVGRVSHHRGTLLMVWALCVFTTMLMVVISIAVSLSD